MSQPETLSFPHTEPLQTSWSAMWSSWPSDCRFAILPVRLSPGPPPTRSPCEFCSGSEQYYVPHERKWRWQSHGQTSFGQWEMAVVSLKARPLSFPRVLKVLPIKQITNSNELGSLNIICKKHNLLNLNRLLFLCGIHKISSWVACSTQKSRSSSVDCMDLRIS